MEFADVTHSPRGLNVDSVAEIDSSQFKLVPKVTISDNTSEVFCVRFSPDGKFLTAGCGDGAIRVFNTSTGVLTYNLQGGSSIALPTTSIRFRPVNAASRTKNVFLAANAAGAVQHWHMTSGKCLHTLEDDDNQVYALDYNEEGTHFATAGRDKAVRVYDEATKTLISKMQGGARVSPRDTPGHSNRIFSAKFAPTDQNIVVSGGWDNTVQFWDIRVGAAVRSLYGPHICGDSLDIVNNEIVTGSWRPDNQLELWDFGSGSRITTIPFNSRFGGSSNSCMLYAAQFSKESQGHFIVAGGSGANEAKVFDHHNGNSLVGTITGLSRGIFTADFSAGDFGKFAVAGGDATIRIFDIVSKDSTA